MFHQLASLHQLLVNWSSTASGKARLNAIGRNTELQASITRLSSSISSMTNVAPSSDALAAAVYAALTR